MPLNEQAVQFVVQNQRLWGMLHLPAATSAPVPAVLMLHGFTGQRGEGHRLFVLFARLLAEAGIAAMRFDFRGSGESEGTFDEMTTSREIQDVLAAKAFLLAQPHIDASRVGLLGLSMGGMVAALSLAHTPFSALALWAAAHPRLWLQEFPENITEPQLRAGIVQMSQRELPAGIGFEASTGLFEFFGNPVSPEFFVDLLAHDVYKSVQSHQGPALVVQGSADPVVPMQAAQGYVAALQARANTETVFHVVQDGLHTFETVPAQREAHGVTLDFFKRHLLS